MIKISYDLRSRMVHGLDYTEQVTINEEEISLRLFVYKVEELLRESINKALGFKNQDALIQKIEESIFKDTGLSNK